MTGMLKQLPVLPAERALKVISGRWKAVILYHLLQGPLRLSELTRLMPAVSQKVLIQQLREMEAHGIVLREIFRQVPPRVEYTATALGRSLEPVLLALCDWGRRHAEELDEADRVTDCGATLRQRSGQEHPGLRGAGGRSVAVANTSGSSKAADKRLVRSK